MEKIVFVKAKYIQRSRYWLHKIRDILYKIEYPYNFKYLQDEIILRNIKFKATTDYRSDRDRIGYRNFIVVYDSDIEKIKPILEIIKKYELLEEHQGQE